jgi:hypothetical protein
MAQIAVDGNVLRIEVVGFDKVLALRSHLDVPLTHVRAARADPDIAKGWFHGLKAAGANIPGVVTAGTFYSHGERTFWDVHDPAKVIVIDLDHESFSHLVLGVDDPAAAVHLIQEALGR